MTAIVGLVHAGTVWIAGDAAGTNPDGDTMVTRTPKVFRVGPTLVGIAGSFRAQNLLQFELRLPKAVTGDVTRWIVRHVAQRTQSLLAHKAASGSGSELGGDALVGVNGRLYILQTDFSVIEPARGETAIGSGADYALGALYANRRRHPKARCFEALEAAALHNTTVSPPFSVVFL